MNLTIDITADLESRLLEEAAKHGMDPREYVIDALRTRLQGNGSIAPRLTAAQSELLEDINRGLLEVEWNHYYDLVARRQHGALTEEEFSELEALSNRIEELNSDRIECLAELATLRGTTLTELMEQMGVVPLPVI